MLMTFLMTPEFPFPYRTSSSPNDAMNVNVLLPVEHFTFHECFPMNVPARDLSLFPKVDEKQQLNCEKRQSLFPDILFQFLLFLHVPAYISRNISLKNIKSISVII